MKPYISKSLLMVVVLPIMLSRSCSLLSLFGGEDTQEVATTLPSEVDKVQEVEVRPTETGEDVIVTATSLYVREKPTKNSKAIDVLFNGDIVSLSDKCEGDWCFISYYKDSEGNSQKISGWVFRKYLEPPP